ncbi:MAG TPA: hypothetical protein VJZ26_05910 [Blastocatellia bacterium]|nr:hypothetical protein [Blastocatellia bacterium]
MIDPETTDEWQEAVNIAHICLLLRSAQLFGLVIGAPFVNADRCARILELGRERKIYPQEGAVEIFIAGCQAVRAS